MKILNFAFIILLFLSLLNGCKRISKLSVPEKSAIIGLATPIVLDVSSETVVNLEDYFLNVSYIDSVTHGSTITTALSKDKKELKISAPTEMLAIVELKVWQKGYAYSLLLKKSRKSKVVVEYKTADRNIKSVQLTGDFNNWNPSNTSLKLDNGIWKALLTLNPGRYSYQIVVDGKWMLDPANKDSVDNNMGAYNSLLNVGNADNASTPKLSTLKFNNNKITISAVNSCDEVFVLWQNFRLPDDNIIKNNNLFSFDVPQQASKMERSFIRIFAYNKQGVSNDLLIPLKNGKIILSSQDLNRADMQANIMYFMMVDRFKNASTKNDAPIKDKDVDPKANYYGGDLLGITEKIKDDYFSDLGVNMLWVSPIMQNPLTAYKEFPKPNRKYSGYHGYWPISITKIDTRYGTSQEFKELINGAHNKEINVILDYVANHVHEDSPLFKQHPDWATKLNLPDGRKNIRLWDEQRLTTWFDTFLPTWDFSKPQVTAQLTDSAIFWIKEYGLDGFRHDATKHVPEVFWRTLSKKIKLLYAENPEKTFYQIGETYGSRELIGSYINSGELDAQFDFNLFFDARAVFAKDDEPFSKLKNSLQESLAYYGYHNLMGNISGNHDLPRFISLASGALSFNEDDKDAGWKREVGVNDPVGYAKLKSLIAFIMTIPGIPIIYYGDEIGMPGANDPDNRRMMKFENLSDQEKLVKSTVKKLIELRRKRMSLMYGNIDFIEVSEHTFGYIRSYFGEISIVLFNKDKSSKTITVKLPEQVDTKKIKSNFNSKLQIVEHEIKVNLKPNSFEILVN